MYHVTRIVVGVSVYVMICIAVHAKEEYVTVPIKTHGNTHVKLTVMFDTMAGYGSLIEHNDEGDEIARNAVKYQDGSIEQLKQLAQKDEMYGRVKSEVNDASAVGSIAVGYATTESGSVHACAWLNGEIIDLGTLGGRKSVAYGVSPNGRYVTGSAQTSDGDNHAFLVDMSGDRTMRDLGVLSEARTRVKSESGGSLVTNDGVVYGMTGIAQPAVGLGDRVAFVHDGTMRRLKHSDDQNVTIRLPSDRNIHGDIVGFATFQRQQGPIMRDDLSAFVMRDDVVIKLHEPFSRAHSINDQRHILGITNSSSYDVLWHPSHGLIRVSSLVNFDQIKHGLSGDWEDLETLTISSDGTIACRYDDVINGYLSFLLVPDHLEPDLPESNQKQDPEALPGWRAENESLRRNNASRHQRSEKLQLSDVNEDVNLKQEERRAERFKKNTAERTKLIFITHGYTADATGFVSELRELFVNHPAVGDEYHVVGYDWSLYSGKEPAYVGFVKTPVPGDIDGRMVKPIDAAVIARQKGKKWGKIYDKHDLDEVHLIGHSAGCHFVEAMAEELNDDDTYVHLTLLDAFVPNNSVGSRPFGDADFVEHYRDSRTRKAMFTPVIRSVAGKAGPKLVNCWNYDVARHWDKGIVWDTASERWSAYHAWPYQWYMNSMGTGYGLDMALAFGGRQNHTTYQRYQNNQDIDTILEIVDQEKGKQDMDVILDKVTEE